MTSGSHKIVYRKATDYDIDSLKRLADAHRHELGFIRRPALLEAIARGEVTLAEGDGQILGFAEYHHRKDRQTTLHNIVVEPRWRNLGIGRQLFQELFVEMAARQQAFLLLKCPIDLPANSFYEQLGFHQVNIENGKARRLLIWRKDTN